MNQRVVAIILVALFAICFVSTGAIGALTLIKSVVDAAPATPLERPADEPQEVQAPAVEPDEELASVAPAIEPAEEELLAAEDEEEVLDFEPPLIGTAQFAVFHVQKAKLEPWAALQKAARGTRVKVFKNKAPASANPPYLELRDLPVADYAVIAGETLEAGRGLTPAVKAALPKTRRVSVVNAAMPLGITPLLEVSKVMAAFAHATGGVLWDEEAQDYLSAEAWKTRRIDSWEKGLPHASMNYTVFVDTVGKSLELKSAGLRHLGLPELELKNISPASKEPAVALLNATAQILAEGHGMVEAGPLTVSLDSIRHLQQRENFAARTYENAQRSVDLVLVPSGDGRVSTLAITFPGAGTPTERLEAGLASLFGSPEE